MKIATALSITLLLVPAVAAAQSPSPGSRTATAARVETGPQLDGRLDDAVWALGEPIVGFVQQEPIEGAPASERTEVKILYDETAIYLGAWLYDDQPEQIIVGERRRDVNLTESDGFMVVFDTYRDRQNGFVFGTNPGGIEYDGQVRGGGAPTLEWDASWNVATSRDGQGWYVEMRIPFSALRYAGGADQVWGLNLSRYIGRKKEQTTWAPLARQFTFTRLTEAGALAGLEPPPQRVITLTPYALAAAQRVPPLDPNVTYPWEFGADAKVGITQSLSLDLTVNTDFAQVEVDDQQVDLTRFSLFFPEKRPFFLENAGLFSVGLQALPGRTSGQTQIFHSRRIGVSSGGRQLPIEYGGRLSGRAAGLDVGLLHMRTDGLDGIEAENGWTVARVAKELPNRSRVGAIFTSRDSPGSAGEPAAGAGTWGRTYGLDGRLGIGEEWTFTAAAGLVDAPGVDESREMVSLLGEYLSPNWYIRGYYDQVGENFNPQAGFVPYTGFREGVIRIERIIRPATEWMREIRVHTRQLVTWNFDGFREMQVAHFHANFNFEDGSVFSPAFNWQTEGLTEPFRIRGTDFEVPAGTYRGWNFYGNVRTNPTAPVSLTGRYDIGTFLSGDRVGGSLGVTFRRGDTLTGSVNVTHNRLRMEQGDYNTTLTRVGMRYAFTPSLFAQSIVQYSDQTGIWSGNVRVGWLDTAGTGLFLVYNERQTIEIDGVGGIFPRDPLVTPERTFVIKYARQFDLSGLGW